MESKLSISRNSAYWRNVIGYNCLASLLIRSHHKLEHFIKHKLIEKNKAVRLAAAKKTIELLEN